MECRTVKITTFFILPAIAAIVLFAVSIAPASTYRIEDMLKAYIDSSFSWAETEVGSVVVHGDIPNLRPSKITIEKGFPGKTIFRLEYENGATLHATANVRVLDWVVMSKRPFHKEHSFEKSELYLRLMDVSKIPTGAFRNIDDVAGKTLTRSVTANMPVIDNMVSGSPMLKKGHRVVIVVESPYFTITTQGELKENSYVGNHVKTVNISSKKIVTGILVSGNTVKVEF